MNTLRWLLIVPLGAIGFAIGICAILLLLSAVTWLCPAELVISGLCTASWFPAAQEVAISVGAAIGAAAVVGLPSLAAPQSKRLVALVAFCVGSAYVLSLLVMGSSSAPIWVPVACAIASGAVALWVVSVGSRGKNAA